VNEDKATRYNRLKRRVDVASLAWTVVLLVTLVISGGSLALRDGAEWLARLVAPAAWLQTASVAAYVVLLTLLSELGAMPLSFYSGLVLERRYGLSRQSTANWLGDQLKALLLSLVLGVGAAVILYFIVHRYPDGWWLPASIVFALLIVGLANLAPLLLLPLFYTVKPLSRDSLRRRLIALGERAGARVLDAYEWGLGAKTSKANAALTGVGGSRRILVSDTMLEQYSDDEIEVVLAHEMAHHVHGDIWKGIALETALIVVGFFAASRLLRLMAPIAGLRGVDDIAGLPLLLLAAGAVSLVMLPVAHAVSRAHERRADRLALTLTRNPAAFISAMRRLAAQNLAEAEPSRLVQWLFHSHPPIRERIAAAQGFANSAERRSEG
jgi:STE24 endopeptidase